MPEYRECSECGRVENIDRTNRETWITVQAFIEDRSGGDNLGSDVVCGRQRCWVAAMKNLRDGKLRSNQEPPPTTVSEP